MSEDQVKPKRSRLRKARKYALDLLFAADLRQCPLEDVLVGYRQMSEHEIPEYSLRLARGVASHDYLLDGYLAPCLAENWTIERMPRVDRVLARIACYEMVYEDLPPEIAISEAVGLAGELSTDASPAFLNGVLAKVATLIPQAAETDDGLAGGEGSAPVVSAEAGLSPDDGGEPVAATVSLDETASLG